MEAILWKGQIPVLGYHVIGIGGRDVGKRVFGEDNKIST